MTTTDADAEFAALTTDAGRLVMAEASVIVRPEPADVARWRKVAAPEVAAAALRLAQSRRRGLAKFARAGEMWLTPTPLEQATHEVVAAHKARRFAGSTVLDLCSGLGGDAIALAAAGCLVAAIDLDPAMNQRLRWNVRVHGLESRINAVRSRAEATPVPGRALVHIDPDRRAARGSRARSVREYVPGLPFLRSLARSCRGGSIKLGPGTDFAESLGDLGLEFEITSLGGECKEATAWFGALATCQRRATTLPTGASWTNHDGPTGCVAPRQPPGTWLYDPDPSLGRSGLLDGFALEHGLCRVGPGLDLLTGPGAVTSPFLSPFEVLESLPADLKRLRRLVTDHDLGTLEIKTVGVDARPETLRPRLPLMGRGRATLFLLGGDRTLALLARRTGRIGQNEVANPGE